MTEAARHNRKYLSTHWLNPKLIVAGAVILVLFFITTLLNGCAPKPPVAQTAPKPTLVNADILTLNNLNPSFKTIGTLKVPSLTELTSQVQGMIAEVLVENGEKVKEGQILIVIDDVEQTRLFQQAKAAFTSAETRLENATAQHEANLQLIERDKSLRNLARKSYERYRNLQRRNLATAAQVDQANEILQRQESSLISRQNALDTWLATEKELQAALASAQAQLDQAESDLASTQVIAPFSGRIQDIKIAQASRITKGSQLLSLYDDQSLVLEASIPDTVMKHLSQNKKLLEQVTAEAELWDQKYNFTLKSLAQKGTQHGLAVGLFKPASDTEFLALNQSMAVTVNFPLEQPGYAIPISSVYDHAYIYLLTDENTLTRQDITIIGETFINQKRFYVIDAKDIKSGSAYITSQMLSDINGLKVQPIHPES